MDKKEEQKLAKFFGNAFREVVLPEFEKVDERLTKLEENMATGDDIDRLERKLEKIDDRFDRHEKILDDHEVRIKTLEPSSPVV